MSWSKLDGERAIAEPGALKRESQSDSASRVSRITICETFAAPKNERGRSITSSPLSNDQDYGRDYCRAVSAWHATSVAGVSKPVGSKRTTPDSSEQNAR
jgi:hypothetical protein